jgi:peptidoglycan/xylan/chitin deacetylase (PgdA/CDA1 family)
MLDEYEVTATFFVVADVVEHYPGLVESIVERGHEIGCHGLHHACKIDPKTKEPLMSVNEFEGRTLEAKEMLEGVCKDINFRRLYRHRLTQMGHYKLIINFGRSVTKKDKFREV